MVMSPLNDTNIRDGVFYKLAMLGDGGVGKTALVRRYCEHTFLEKYDPTIEDEYQVRLNADGRQYTLNVRDVSGLEVYEELQTEHIRQSEAFVLVYSISSRHSFRRITTLHARVQALARPTRAETPTHLGSPCPQTFAHPGTKVSIFLVGNKCDLLAEREITKEEGRALAKKLRCGFMETSARSNLNVKQMYCDLSRQVHVGRYAGQEEAGFQMSTGVYKAKERGTALAQCRELLRKFRKGLSLRRCLP